MQTNAESDDSDMKSELRFFSEQDVLELNATCFTNEKMRIFLNAKVAPFSEKYRKLEEDCRVYVRLLERARDLLYHGVTDHNAGQLVNDIDDALEAECPL